jgi:hypothetical protein
MRFGGQLLTQEGFAAGEAGHDGANGEVEDVRNFLVRMLFEVEKC